MQLFYNPEIIETTKSFFFSKEESKHIVKVLRKQENDILHVTNGLGFLFETKIIAASDTKCVVEICSFQKEKAQNWQLHLAVAPTKMNDRYEWFLEKATEIGIQVITPIVCERSERKTINKERFEKIILTAMKQSNQLFLPKLNEPISFKNFMSKKQNEQLFIAHCETTDKKTLKSTLKINKNVTILIGPEGDFTTKEIDLALEKKYVPISLGNTRLRTETAALVACHTTVLLNEN